MFVMFFLIKQLGHFLVMAALSHKDIDQTCWDCGFFPKISPLITDLSRSLQVKVFASYSLSGRPLNPFDFSIAEPEAVQNLCQRIYATTGIVTHQQRLLLEDGQVLRMRSGAWEPRGSLHEICPSLLSLLSAEKTCQDLDLGSWRGGQSGATGYAMLHICGIQGNFYCSVLWGISTDVWVIWVDLECLADVSWSKIIYVLWTWARTCCCSVDCLTMFDLCQQLWL